jgi:hypothetical protein
MRALLKNRDLMEQATLASSQAASPTSAPTSAPTVPGRAAASVQAPAPSAANTNSDAVPEDEVDYEAESEIECVESEAFDVDSQQSQLTALFDISQDDDKEEGETVPLHEMPLYLRVPRGEFRSECETTNISRVFDKDDEISITMPLRSMPGSRSSRYRIPRRPNKREGAVVAETIRKPGFMTDRMMDLIQNAVMVSGHCYYYCYYYSFYSY